MHKKGKIYRVCWAGLSLQNSLKVFPSQGVIVLSSLKPCIPSGLNPRIYGSYPLKTWKSSSSKGFYSPGFMGIDTQELQNRSKTPDPAVLDLPLPFSPVPSPKVKEFCIQDNPQLPAP